MRGTYTRAYKGRKDNFEPYPTCRAQSCRRGVSFNRLPEAKATLARADIDRRFTEGRALSSLPSLSVISAMHSRANAHFQVLGEAGSEAREGQRRSGQADASGHEGPRDAGHEVPSTAQRRQRVQHQRRRRQALVPRDPQRG